MHWLLESRACSEGRLTCPILEALEDSTHDSVQPASNAGKEEVRAICDCSASRARCRRRLPRHCDIADGTSSALGSGAFGAPPTESLCSNNAPRDNPRRALVAKHVQDQERIADESRLL